jgi:hypothetical protein
MSNGNVNHVMLFRLAYTFFVFLVICFIGVMVIMFYPFNPIDFKKATLHQKTVKAGDIIEYTAEFEKFANKTGTMTRTLVCEKQSPLVLSTSIADASCDSTSKAVSVEIPRATKVGKCKIAWTVVYDYGIRGVPKSFETPIFEVLGRTSITKGEKGDKGDTGSRGKTGKTGTAIFGK